VTGSGVSETVGVTSLNGIDVGSVVTVDGPNQETVTVTAINVAGPPAAPNFQAIFTKAHPPTAPPGQVPTSGFPIQLCEGTDGDKVPSIRSSAHTLHFTVNLAWSNVNTLLTANPLRREFYFSTRDGDSNYTPAPPPLDTFGPPAFRDINNHIYNSQWAEVAYFLVPVSGSFTAPPGSIPGGQQLFNLYRRLQVIVTPPQPAFINDETAAHNAEPPRVQNSPTSKKGPYYFEVSCRPDPDCATPRQWLFFNTPEYVTIPERRFGMNQTVGSAGWPPQNDASPPVNGPSNGTSPTYPRIALDGNGEGAILTGADLLLTDVLSCDVQVFMPGINATDFINIPPQGYTPSAHNNNAYPNDNIPYTGKRIYDTWSKEPTSPGPGAFINNYDYANSDSTFTAAKTAPFNVQHVTAVQITLRIWDFKTQKTRQITIIQDT
jgi:hypothetical protein